MTPRRSIVVTLHRTSGILDLVRREVPRPVKSGGEFDDWSVMAPALIAIAGDLFESIISLPPPRGRVRAEILARSLAEYAITFAWLAAPSLEEERAKRRNELVKDEFLERGRAENKLRHQIKGRAEYTHLFEGGKVGGPTRRAAR